MKPANDKKRLFGTFIQAIVSGDMATAAVMLSASPNLAQELVLYGPDRQTPRDRFFNEILHYMYEGDSALHIAAAAYQKEIAMDLIAKGADVRARNRRGAEPLHYASDGVPGSPRWNPAAQAATITVLIEAGADPDSRDKSGVAPLHRAVRTRCAAAVAALLNGGADACTRNKSGSTPLVLARQNTGRGGSGSPEARGQQKEILRLLRADGAT